MGELALGVFLILLWIYAEGGIAGVVTVLLGFVGWIYVLAHPDLMEAVTEWWPVVCVAFLGLVGYGILVSGPREKKKAAEAELAEAQAALEAEIAIQAEAHRRALHQFRNEIHGR